MEVCCLVPQSIVQRCHWMVRLEVDLRVAQLESDMAESSEGAALYRSPTYLVW